MVVVVATNSHAERLPVDAIVPPGSGPSGARERELGDFTTTRSVLGLVWSVLVPVVGGLIVGAMARIGSERIRGHGIPEAMETILLRCSRGWRC
jgi:H+/Cl- antiporter ClcA